MRIRFEVSLESTGEVDFKALAKTLESSAPTSPPKPIDLSEGKEDEIGSNIVDLTDDDPTAVASTPIATPAHVTSQPAPPGSPTPLPSRGRFNIIEHLEQRYGKGGILDIKGKAAPVRKNVDDDDLYDSEDSFIDDSDLHDSIENTYMQSTVKTKHSGFFVNAGDNIETVKDPSHKHTASTGQGQQSADGFDDESPKKKSKKSLHDDMYLDDDWQPGPDVDALVAKFKQQATEYFGDNPPPKLWPPALDEGLREVDKVVVAAHPQRWRVNGYMGYLMGFLPYTKTTLRARMIMLEARDNAADVKLKIDEHFTAFQTQVALHAADVEAGKVPTDQIKEVILADAKLAEAIYFTLTTLDDWVNKENEYRPLLKQDDKKQLDEADTVALATQKERNRLYNKMVASLPTSLSSVLDLSGLRELFKLGRKSSGHKTTTPHATPTTKKAAAAGSAKRATKTPPAPKVAKVKDASEPAATKPPPVAKKLAKPLRSRRFETCPIWSLDDFMDERTPTVIIP